MSNYNSVTPEFIDELKTLLGESYVKTDADTLDRYKTDEEADERCFHLPDVVVLPADAEQIAGGIACIKQVLGLRCSLNIQRAHTSLHHHVQAFLIQLDYFVQALHQKHHAALIGNRAVHDTRTAAAHRQPDSYALWRYCRPWLAA